MEHYIVSARKYRPSTFHTVIGQKPLTAALKHAVATDRLAHAYLFCGSRGVGKTSCARIFAKTINCEHRTPEGEACNECESCRAFNNGTSLNIIELDAASHNGIDDIKSLTEQVMVPPTQGRYRVFIIDEVHMLSSAAFNAFLKTLEEPPEYVIFILATTEKHKIIPTILSRCQIYDFNRITIQDMVEHLTYVASNENVTVEPAALNVIARKADGAMRDALSIFDQVAASTMGQVTYRNTIDNLNILDNTYYTRLVEAFLSDDVPTALLIYQEVREHGFDSQFFVNGLAQYMRDLMVARDQRTLSLLEASDDVRAELAGVAAKCTPQWLYSAMDLCNTADLNFKIASNKQFLVELTLVKLCQLVAPRQAPQPAQPMRSVQTPVAQPATQPAAQPTPQPTPQPAVQPAPQSAAPVLQTPPAAHTAQPIARPMAAPGPQTYTPPRPTPRDNDGKKAGALPSFTLHKDEAADQESAASADDTYHRKNNSYTQEQVDAAWREIIDMYPKELILVNTIKDTSPRQVEGNLYRVTVDDPIQINAVTEHRADIINHLRDKLGNDEFDFDMEVRQSAPSPSTWTQRQVLQHMVDKHPAIGEIISEFSFNM